MKKFINNDENFGDAGPFYAETREDLLKEIRPTIDVWADEEIMRHYDINGTWPPAYYKGEVVAMLEEQFLDGLEAENCVGVEMQFSGTIDEDSLEKAREIASGVHTQEEAWAEVELLDEPTKNAIYEAVVFIDITEKEGDE